MWAVLFHRFRRSIRNDRKRGYSTFIPGGWSPRVPCPQPVYNFYKVEMPRQWAPRLIYPQISFGRRCGGSRSSIVLPQRFRCLKCGVIFTQRAPLVSLPTPSNLSPSHLTKDLHDFKDRLRPLGPGKVNLSLDDKNGLAKLTLVNQDRRNGENPNTTSK